MSVGIRALVIGICILCGSFLPATVVHGDIVGFNNLSGWSYNQGDGGSPADLPNAHTVHLTSGNSQRRSLFFNTPQDITEFTATFTYRATNFNGCLVGQGIAFVLQNNASGAGALGNGSGGLGYAGMTTSAATILVSDTGPGQTYNGFFTNGSTGGGSNVTSPANAFNFRDLVVQVTYSNPVFTVTIDDPLIAGSPDFTRNYVVGDLATTLGSSTAYVGFTASTGDNFGNGGSNQYLSNFSYYVPEPSSLLALLAGTFLVSRKLRATRLR